MSLQRMNFSPESSISSNAKLPVQAVSKDEGNELATSGIVNARCVGEDSSPELVINGNSDVRPSAAGLVHSQ